MSKASHRKHEHKQSKHQPQPLGDHIDTSFHEPSAWTDAGIVICLISLAFFFLVPFATVMPTALVFAILVLFALVIVVFMAMTWKARPTSGSHQRHIEAGHVTYLAAVFLLSLGVVVQVLRRQLDWWLPAILIALVIVHMTYRRTGKN